MADVIPPVELTAERADHVPVIAERRASTGFPAGHAAEDGQLVREALDGNPGAFTRLYERYGRLVHGRLLVRVRRVDRDDRPQPRHRLSPADHGHGGASR